MTKKKSHQPRGRLGKRTYSNVANCLSLLLKYNWKIENSNLMILFSYITAMWLIYVNKSSSMCLCVCSLFSFSLSVIHSSVSSVFHHVCIFSYYLSTRRIVTGMCSDAFYALLIEIVLFIFFGRHSNKATSLFNNYFFLTVHVFDHRPFLNVASMLFR